jgi:hypothetical protein
MEDFSTPPCTDPSSSSICFSPIINWWKHKSGLDFWCPIPLLVLPALGLMFQGLNPLTVQPNLKTKILLAFGAFPSHAWVWAPPKIHSPQPASTENSSQPALIILIQNEPLMVRPLSPSKIWEFLPVLIVHLNVWVDEIPTLWKSKTRKLQQFSFKRIQMSAAFFSFSSLSWFKVPIRMTNRITSFPSVPSGGTVLLQISSKISSKKFISVRHLAPMSDCPLAWVQPKYGYGCNYGATLMTTMPSSMSQPSISVSMQI